MLGEGTTAIDVFISYSHADEELREELEAHLTTLKRQGLIHTWNDRDIAAGTGWRDEIDRNLTCANVIFLLVSPAFLRSDYCWEKEMTRALERHRAGEARVIPIILRSCDWHHSPLGELQALPRDGKPVTLWPDRDEAFLDIVRGVRQVVEGLRKRSVATPPPRSTPPQAPTPPPTPLAKAPSLVFPKAAAEPRPGAPTPTPPIPRPGSVGLREHVHPQDGSVLVWVTEGARTLGTNDDLEAYAAAHQHWSKPEHSVHLSGFWIGKLTVTNRQYQRFLDANPGHPKPAFWGDPRFNEQQQPVVGVSWMDAQAYCRWASLVLPTEAQWEAAARGYDRRRYPWGDQESTNDRAKFGAGWATGKPALAGSYLSGAGPFGTLNQAGNVWEWCADVFRADAYTRRAGKHDPREPGEERNESLFRVVRGGSWATPAQSLHAALRNWFSAGSKLEDVGFRVAFS